LENSPFAYFFKPQTISAWANLAQTTLNAAPNVHAHPTLTLDIILSQRLSLAKGQKTISGVSLA